MLALQLSIWITIMFSMDSNHIFHFDNYSPFHEATLFDLWIFNRIEFHGVWLWQWGSGEVCGQRDSSKVGRPLSLQNAIQTQRNNLISPCHLTGETG